MTNPDSWSPWRIFWLIAGAIFLVELAVMFLLPPALSPPVEAALDAAVLVGVLFPVLYFLLLRPMLRGVAERERLIAELREKDMFNRLIVEDAVDPIILIDEKGLIQTFNRAAERVFGYAATEVAGRNVNVLMPSPVREEHDGYVGRYLATGRRRVVGTNREATALRKSGERFPVELAVSEIDVRGRRGFVGIVRDITERKRTEAALHESHEQLEMRVRERTAELAKSVVELEQRNRETALLAELGELLHSCTSVEEACEITRHTAPRLFAGTTGALFGFSASRDDLESIVTWGEGAADLARRIPDPGKCWALRRGRSHQNRDLCGGMSCRGAASAARTLCVPMTAQSETLGVLYLEAKQEPQSAEVALNERLATTLAEQLGLALVNLRLRETLRIQSIVDPLTGLFNRRFMEETLKRELSRAQRRQHGLAVIMLDLDHFKRFNDTFGHDAGDALLRGLGEFLQSQVRGSDVPCRFGGEEFLLILPEIDHDTARQRAEAIRAGISQLGIAHQGQSLGSVTASLGVAVFPQHGTDFETLQHIADQALYHAKQAGRDRVVFAEAQAIAVLAETPHARVQGVPIQGSGALVSGPPR